MPSTKKYLKKINEESINYINNIDHIINKLNKEYEKELYEKLEYIVQLISEGENININILKDKYLYKIVNKKKSKNKTENIKLDETEILEKVDINGETYYYQNKDGGNIYNIKSIVVGNYNEGKWEINN
jgi:hypothetical protein